MSRETARREDNLAFLLNARPWDLKKDAWRQLRMLGLEQDKSGQVLLVEAVNLLFKEYAKPQVA